MQGLGKGLKAVIFDFDDTLVGSVESKWAQHKHVARTFYDFELTDTELKLHWGKPFNEMVMLLYKTDNLEVATKNVYSCRLEYPKVLFKGSFELLEKLHALGIKVGIITATSRYGFDQDLSQHNFPSHTISYTQTSEDTSFHKPDPKVFEPTIAWLSSHDIAPNQAVYIGDGLRDMQAAIGSGLNFIGVETGMDSEDLKSSKVKTYPTIGHINSLVKAP